MRESSAHEAVTSVPATCPVHAENFGGATSSRWPDGRILQHGHVRRGPAVLPVAEGDRRPAPR